MARDIFTHAMGEKYDLLPGSGQIVVARNCPECKKRPQLVLRRFKSWGAKCGCDQETDLQYRDRNLAVMQWNEPDRPLVLGKGKFG